MLPQKFLNIGRGKHSFFCIITIYEDSLVTKILKNKNNKTRQHKTQNLLKTYTAHCKFCM